MAYQIRYALEIVFVPDGAGPMSIASMQKLKLGSLEFAGLTVQNPQITTTGQPTGYQQVPGANAPSQANFDTALESMEDDLSTAIAANLVRIQGFATGGG